MWSEGGLPRRAVLGGLAAGLAGCGFAPVYAPGAPATALRGAVRPDPAANALGFAFATRIEERLGAAPVPRFGLGYAIALDREERAVSRSLSILRYSLSGRIDWRLRDLATETPLTSGRAETFTAYSAIGTTVATRAAQRDAEARLGVLLADAVVTDLLATAPGWLP